MAIVDLNRRFHEWNETERPDPEMRRVWGLDDGGIGWPELLTKRRAVVLAEAGSGKTTEFAQRARMVGVSNCYVFHASVEDVGRDGLDDALSVEARIRLAEWKKGIDEAWFFLDSVDEAKVAGVKFDRVVRKLAEGIHGAEDRCYIILSGRVTDWEPQRDRELLKKWLPVSSVIAKPEPTPEEELLRIVRSERKPKEEAPPDEAPFVAIMAQLDRERVRLFAEGAGIADVEQFLKAIDDADLWHFARRPLDLDWLVRFWKSEGRLGTLQEMVERSIVERLKEPNPDRSRTDDLNNVAMLHAVERVGAAMVFGRQTTIAIPDREAALASDSSLDLADILPDWSADDRIRLLTRPIFDPATFGRVRFHNDNDGTVRSFLAARWLLRLRKSNLSTSNLFRLLFSTSYGLEVIKPSLNETTAWLCLWDKDVANEVVRRAPDLLLSAGDPASLSVGVRSAALTALLHALTNGDQEWPWWDNDKLRRFAQSDLGNAVLELWPQYRTHGEAAELLMRLVWLGALKECEPLAREIAFDSGAQPLLRVFAGKALLAMSSAETRADYAALVVANAVSLHLRLVRDAIIEFFPELISISDVLQILSALKIEDDQNGPDFARDGLTLAKKIESVTDLEAFLVGLVAELKTKLGDHAHHPPTKREEALFPAMAESALRLLKRVDASEVPPAAIEAIMRISNRREHGTQVRQTANEALVELHRTAERRRKAFWHVVSNLRTISGKQAVNQLWHVEFLGYPTGLKVEDIDWLLADGPSRGGADCQLAVNTALAIYQFQGQPASLLAKIARTVESDSVARDTFQEWNTPRIPSEEELESKRELEAIQAQNKAEADKRDQSWIDFIRELRSDSDRIAKLRLPVPLDRRSELMDLWQLLHSSGNQSRYAVDSVSPLERIAGPEVANAVVDGLIAHWRICEPLVRSRRKPEERNSVRWLDLMGLTGITLEAARDATWASKLSADEARRATEFATLEINGFPRWFPDVVASHSDEVRAILHHEITDELTRQGVTFFETLNAITYSNETLAPLLAPALLRDLEAGLSLPQGAVALVLQILLNGLAEADRQRLEKLGLSRFDQETELSLAVQYLAAVLSINPVAATATLVQKASALDDEGQTKLVDRFLTACFGDSMSGSGFKAITAPPAVVIEELMLLSFKSHKQIAARRRPAGVVYRMDNRDYADEARSAIFTRFVKTPGIATYDALRRLQQDPTFPVAPTRLRALAEQRAVEDSESAPWLPDESYAFEQSAETSPRTGKDLRSVLVGRIEDMQHELLHDDFSQGHTLKGLSPEREVQKWVADRLRVKQGRSYSVEREPHVVDEKEPDVRIRAKQTDANVSMEIKVAESWTLQDLVDALEVQLCGRYLRSDQGRYGVLLLVHQEARPVGWEDKVSGRYLTFAEVVARLQARAREISGGSYNAPQPEVAVLDVTSC